MSLMKFGGMCTRQTLDLLQAVTMPTFVLHGVHMMYGWRTFHVSMLLKVGRSFKLLVHD